MWVQPSLSRVELTSLTQQIVDEVRREGHPRNPIIQQAHAGRLADVVWVFAYKDPVDQPVTSLICRAIWISAELDPRWAPMRFGDRIPENPELSIDWRDKGTAIREPLDQKRLDKRTYLRAIDSYMTGVRRLIDAAGELVGTTGPLTDEAEHRMSALADLVAQVAWPDEQRVAPYELTPLEDAYGAANAQLMDIFMPFTKRGRAIWSANKRAGVTRMSLRKFDEDWQRFQVERDRVR